LKENITRIDVMRSSPNSRIELVLLKYIGGVKVVSYELRHKTEQVALGIRDKVTDKIVKIGESIKLAEIRKMLLPKEEMREILAAAGKVTLAGLGAAQISFEVMFDTTETVAKKSNAVAADVVSYKFGTTSGQAFENTSDSVYTAFRALMLLGILSPESMFSAVLKNTGKAHVQKDFKDDYVQQWVHCASENVELVLKSNNRNNFNVKK